MPASLLESKSNPSIARIWRGRVARERADEYREYNFEVGVKPLIQKALGVQCFREDRETETEFVTISYWESPRCANAGPVAPSSHAAESARQVAHVREVRWPFTGGTSGGTSCDKDEEIQVRMSNSRF